MLAGLSFYIVLFLLFCSCALFDKLVVNCGSGQATSDEKTDCKVAFILDDKLYTEGQLDELQRRLKATKVGLSGVGNVPKPIPGVDLSGYDVTFYFYSKPVTR
jgi:hypothetical protein